MRHPLIAAPRIEICAPVAARAQFLVEAYSDIVADPSRLLLTLDRLRPFHPAERLSSWQELALSGRHSDLALALMQLHYDPRYERSRAQSAHAIRRRIDCARLSELDIDGIAARVMDAAGEVTGSAHDASVG
jgi:tRNA 2-selenouridine synthase